MITTITIPITDLNNSTGNTIYNSNNLSLIFNNSHMGVKRGIGVN